MIFWWLKHWKLLPSLLIDHVWSKIIWPTDIWSTNFWPTVFRLYNVRPTQPWPGHLVDKSLFYSMTFDQMSFDQMSFDQMSFDQTSFGPKGLKPYACLWFTNASQDVFLLWQLNFSSICNEVLHLLNSLVVNRHLCLILWHKIWFFSNLV
jgi:hypothetical protein